MDIWQLIERDHANIADLIREIPYALNDPGAVGGRERLLADLIDTLELHTSAVDASLCGPLSREGNTKHLVEDLQHGHAEFMGQLHQLAHYPRKRPEGWLNTFEDITFLVDQHLHRHTHELIPAARSFFSPEEVAAATRAYVRAKTRALLGRHRNGAANGIMSSEGALIATVAAVATGLGYLVWRSGFFNDGQSTHAKRSGRRHAR